MAISQRSPRYLPFLILLTVHACVLEYTVRTRDWFHWYPYIDNLMHFGWGAVIAMAIIVFWRNSAKHVLISILIWQMLWEAGEMVQDRIVSQPGYMQDHFFPDGMIDTLMDLLGGVAALLFTRRDRIPAQVGPPS